MEMNANVEDSLTKIAHELKRRNDMDEIKILLDAAEKIRSAAKATTDDKFYVKCHTSARALMNVAMDKLGLNIKDGQHEG